MKEIANREKQVNFKELVINARIDNLGFVQDFIAGELEACACPVKLQMQLALVAEEIFVNIANYAYNQDTVMSSLPNSGTEAGNVAIRIAAGDEVIVIEFEDSGKPFNPLEKDDPDLTSDAEEREIGGLGIFMVKNMTDAIKYRYEGNKNILMIKKKVA